MTGIRSCTSAANLFGLVMTIAPREIIRLPATRCVLPFIVARGRDEAAPFLEGIAKHRLLSDRLGTGVERGTASLGYALRASSNTGSNDGFA